MHVQLSSEARSLFLGNNFHLLTYIVYDTVKALARLHLSICALLNLSCLTNNDYAISTKSECVGDKLFLVWIHPAPA